MIPRKLETGFSFVASFENIFQQSRKLGKLQTDVGTKYNSEFSNLPQRENVSNFENKKRKIFYDLFVFRVRHHESYDVDRSYSSLWFLQ